VKLTIRKGMFETNSSSMHSIIITKNNSNCYEEGLKCYCKGVLRFLEDDIEFSRSPFQFLNTWRGKVAYAIASYCQKYKRDDEEAKEFISKLEAIIKKHVKDFDHIELPDPEDTWYPFGYVDHQSEGLLQKFLSEENVTLEDFIFTPKYIVVIDGDEYCIFDSMKKDLKFEVEKEVLPW